MKDKVPDTIHKRKKHGFNVPVHKWLETDLKSITQELLSKRSIAKRGLFNYNYVGKYKDKNMYNNSMSNNNNKGKMTKSILSMYNSRELEKN